MSTEPKLLKVYIASKLCHADKWHELRETWPEVVFVMRWPFCHVGNIPDDPVFAKIFWEQDLEDVSKSDVVLVYAEPGEKLRGALVEAGMAIALGKCVICVGVEHQDFGTWTHHPLVHRVVDLGEARLVLKCLSL